MNNGLTLKSYNIGTLQAINFQFGKNGNLTFLGVPILKLIKINWPLSEFSVSDLIDICPSCFLKPLNLLKAIYLYDPEFH